MSIVVSAVFIALFAGHQVGDHVIQSDADARAKGAPTADLLARGTHPWTGWPACLRHVASYTLVQAAALALTSLVAPLTLAGVIAALTVSASTHAVIDRRWLVRWLIAVKGCHGWREAPYVLDQSIHIGVLLVASVVAAAVHTPGAALGVLALSAAIVVAALVFERRMASDAGRTGAGAGRTGADAGRHDSGGRDSGRRDGSGGRHDSGGRDSERRDGSGGRRVAP
ncbi:MAG TPA: DUF3307 domain-containing protein [Candidatus Limnocylindrales bacterium]|nr:DUF3307 domain-containing protein [Candidatus Limnocylindrales bacterium]